MIKKLKRITQFKSFYILAILLLSVPVAIPLIHSGYYHFSDEPHLANLYEMVRTISYWQIPPRFSPDMLYDFGYPLFNFYYPLPYYIGSLFYLFTGSLIISIKLTFLISIPLSGMFMFLWLKNHTTKFASLVGSIIFLYLPYKAVDYYVRGALGEIVAFVFFPLILYLVDKVKLNSTFRNMGLLSLATGLFMLSHNLAPLIFLPWLFLYILTIFNFKLKNNAIWKILISLLIGFLIASFWLIPAFVEKNLLQSQTPFNYKDHFPFIKQLFYSPMRYGASLPGPNDDLTFQLGFSNWILAIYSLVILLGSFSKRKLHSKLIFFTATFIAFILLMNIRSSFLWEIFPLASYFQFPWRLLMMAGFVSSAMVIFVKNYNILFLLAFISIIFYSGYFKPSGFYYPDDNYFLKRFFANRVVTGQSNELSQEYINYSEDYLLLTKWTQKKPNLLPASKFESKDVNIVNTKEVTPFKYELDIDPETEGQITANLYYFPGWHAKLNGKEVEIEPKKPYGNFTVHIPKGSSKLEIYWAETTFRKMFNIISLLALLSSIFCIIYKSTKNK